MHAHAILVLLHQQHTLKMADTEKERPSALENGSDVSDHGEKRNSAVFQNTDDTDLPDPDASKSPEERAKIVRVDAAASCWHH